jgi:hypothetical protein
VWLGARRGSNCPTRARTGRALALGACRLGAPTRASPARARAPRRVPEALSAAATGLLPLLQQAAVEAAAEAVCLVGGAPDAVGAIVALLKARARRRGAREGRGPSGRPCGALGAASRRRFCRGVAAGGALAPPCGPS